ncbi:MAG: hypothetical protein NTV22_08985 [bacterium]|nr:hypothetical protein [bacterium]
MKITTALLAALALILGAQHALALQSVYVKNASFEAPAGNPDWTYSSITDWEIEAGKTQVGVCSGGFADNGQRPDKTQVAFLYTDGTIPVGESMYIRTVSIAGLDTTKKYCLQFWHNARGYLDTWNTNICKFEVAVGTLVLGTNTSIAVGGNNPYNFTSYIFTPVATTGKVRFRNIRLPNVGSDGQLSTLLLDGICLYQLGHTNDILVKNPSFEASGYQGPGGGYGFINRNAAWGYINDFMAGWTYYCGGSEGPFGPAFGVGTNANLYFAVAPVPEGQDAFFDNKSEMYYPGSSKQTMLKQTIDGLTVDQDYCLSYNYQARGGYNPSNFTVKIGGIEVHRDDLMPWGTAFFGTTNSFKANASSMELVFGTSNSVDGTTMCIDNVEIWPIPEPLALSALGLGLAAWLAGRRAR